MGVTHLHKRRFNAIDDELYTYSEEEESEHPIHNSKLFFSNAACNNL